MNESILYTIAEVGVTLAGFSGLAVAFRRHDLSSLSPPEFVALFYLLTNCLLVVLFSLLPIPLLLWGLSESTIWIVCSPLMAAWFFGGDVVAIHFVRHHPDEFQWDRAPVWFGNIQWSILAVAAAMGIVLVLSAADLLIPRGQAPYVLGLLLLLVFSGIEFAYFIIVGRHTGTT